MLNAEISMIIFIFSLIMELWLLRNVEYYCSFLQFYVLRNNFNTSAYFHLLNQNMLARSTESWQRIWPEVNL